MKSGRFRADLPAKNQKGQATLFIATILLTFIFFFTFVVNTGLVVSAKINLQNAADLAAYSGAATQARQLTYISYLNYEMRRTFKKFLFRYYAVGNMGQDTHPTTDNGAVRRWGPNNTDPPFGIPVTCIRATAGDPQCSRNNLPSTLSRNSINNLQTSNDTTMSALYTSLKTIEAARKNICVLAGTYNVKLLLLWLTNTDPELSGIIAQQQAAATNPDATKQLQILTAMAGWARGLGLIPKELLLHQRIKTLEQVINQEPETLTRQRVEDMKNSGEFFRYERSIQAYLTAFNSLGNHVFPNPSDIVLRELLPTKAGGADLIKLNDLKENFDVYAMDFGMLGAGVASRTNNPCDPAARQIIRTNDPTSQEKDCVPCLVPFSFTTNGGTMGNFTPVLGVEKDPEILTYYAVRLSAKARLLFSPFGELEMVAYSAAQPFGSRIGPSKTEVSFTHPGSPSAAYSAQDYCSFTNFNNANGATRRVRCAERVPNLSVKQGETTLSGTNGWNVNDVVFNYFRALGGANVVDPPALEQAYHWAMSPTPSELGLYNIPGDLNPNDDPFLRHYDNQGKYAIWAPLSLDYAATGNTNVVAQEIRSALQEMAGGAGAIASLSGTTATMFANLGQELITYINSRLVAGNGENGEGINVYRFNDPTRTLASAGLGPIPINNSRIYVRDPLALRTSWSDTLNAAIRDKKRDTYSVKFVPLKSLSSPNGTFTDGNGGTIFKNAMPGTNGVDTEIQDLQH